MVNAEENGGEIITLRSPADLTLDSFQAVAWEERRLELHPGLLTQLGAARERALAALAAGTRVYGINTGMGYLAGVDLSEEEQRDHQANLLLGRAVGGPPYLPWAEARAVLLARLVGFLGGQAAVSAELCGFLADRLNDGFTPAIPRGGSGSAGEIIPLAHAFQTFMGVGAIVTQDGELEDAAAALAARRVAPYQPGVKEGIALLAGAPEALALGIARWREARLLFRQLLIAAACSIDAIRAPLGPYDPAVAVLANDQIMAGVLARLGGLLHGSDPKRHGTQAPVSFRVIPQVLTNLARTQARLEEDLHRGLRAVTDSPAFVDGRFLSTGGFHAVGLTSDMDTLSIALVQAAELAGQRIHRLLDSRFSGLSDQLTPAPGPRAGLVAVHKRVAGTIHELHEAATPTTLGLVDTSMGQEDAMTFTFESAEKLGRVIGLVRQIAACELLVCRQAWTLRGAGTASGLNAYEKIIADHVEPVEEDRPLGTDIARVEALLAAGEIA